MCLSTLPMALHASPTGARACRHSAPRSRRRQEEWDPGACAGEDQGGRPCYPWAQGGHCCAHCYALLGGCVDPSGSRCHWLAPPGRRSLVPLSPSSSSGRHTGTQTVAATRPHPRPPLMPPPPAVRVPQRTRPRSPRLPLPTMLRQRRARRSRPRSLRPMVPRPRPLLLRRERPRPRRWRLTMHWGQRESPMPRGPESRP